MNNNITAPHLKNYKNQSGETFTLWLTGLSGSGKSTIADALLEKIPQPVMILDGDILRAGLCQDLGFSLDDREENIRRAAQVAKILNCAGVNVIASFISPTNAIRSMAREIIGENFIECYIKVDLKTCEARDPKGLYQKARAGQIPNFTGIGSPFEPPTQPEITVTNEEGQLPQAVDTILAQVAQVLA